MGYLTFGPFHLCVLLSLSPFGYIGVFLYWVVYYQAFKINPTLPCKKPLLKQKLVIRAINSSPLTIIEKYLYKNAILIKDKLEEIQNILNNVCFV